MAQKTGISTWLALARGNMDQNTCGLPLRSFHFEPHPFDHAPYQGVTACSTGRRRLLHLHPFLWSPDFAVFSFWRQAQGAEPGPSEVGAQGSHQAAAPDPGLKKPHPAHWASIDLRILRGYSWLNALLESQNLPLAVFCPIPGETRMCACFCY